MLKLFPLEMYRCSSLRKETAKRKNRNQSKNTFDLKQSWENFGAPENYFSALFILWMTFSQWAVMSKGAYCFLIDYLLK